MNSPALVQKLWNYCSILGDDGLSHGDYVEQLTFLLFLKMTDEQSKPPFNKTSPIPKGKDWPALLAKDGDELEIHYRHTLEDLGKRPGMLGVIFRKAQNKIQDLAMLPRCGVVKTFEEAVPANLQRAARLRQSILQKAFAGKLVNDEEKRRDAASTENWHE